MVGSRERSEVFAQVDGLFRREYGKLVATMARVLGPAHIAMAEEIVQDTLAQALEAWPIYGTPRRPAAWLATVARNRALDLIRRGALVRRLEPEIQEAFGAHSAESPATNFASEIADDQLRMMFASCHPSLPRQSQVALSLKILCGFGISEIARAFLLSESAVEQRIVRAKRQIREHEIAIAVPSPDTIVGRREAVLECLYLMFTEGHMPSCGDDLIREDICRESLRLASLLAEHPEAGAPSAHALCALMLFQMARFRARANDAGELLVMADQERGHWDQRLTQLGLEELRKAMGSEALSVYHVEAGIAACHAVAPSWDATDWRTILEYYDLLMVVRPSPVVALNRAVAAAELGGPERGLAELDALDVAHKVEHYHLYWATRGEFYLRLGRRGDASDAIRRAIALATSEPERRHLWRRLSDCSKPPGRQQAAQSEITHTNVGKSESRSFES